MRKSGNVGSYSKRSNRISAFNPPACESIRSYTAARHQRCALEIASNARLTYANQQAVIPMRFLPVMRNVASIFCVDAYRADVSVLQGRRSERNLGNRSTGFIKLLLHLMKELLLGSARLSVFSRPNAAETRNFVYRGYFGYVHNRST